MNLDRYTADEIRAHEQQLLAHVPADLTIGNVSLRACRERVVRAIKVTMTAISATINARERFQ
jgi:hypothetical protein